MGKRARAQNIENIEGSECRELDPPKRRRKALKKAGKSPIEAARKYEQALFDSVMERYSNGRTLDDICEFDEDVNVRPPTIKRWAKLSEINEQTYSRARLDFAEHLAESTLQIADEEPDPIRARVRVQARHWLASKYNPAVYGDKLDVSHTHSIDIAAALEQARQRIAQASDMVDVTPDSE